MDPSFLKFAKNENKIVLFLIKWESNGLIINGNIMFVKSQIHGNTLWSKKEIG
jgi:hypothetical protein